jgi:EAL domain-containing protein (putative c-di-GMP-specific phosphodiesterase class I)
VQLNQSRLVDSIQQTLQATNLPPDHLELEVTETALMQDVESAIALLHQLKALGVKIAIDDFGTGYASLGYLRQLPIDTLKIDASFIRNIHETPQNQIILKHVIPMAHDLGLQVIAEGVETTEEMQLLQDYACDQIQGYWVGPPAVAAELAQRL